MNEQEVIKRVLSGDDTAFGELVAHYNQSLFRVARSICRDNAIAEDVLQTAYMQAFSNLHRFEQRSTFGTWITRIVLREALRAQKKQIEPWLRLEEIGDSPLDCGETPADQFERAEASKNLEEAIDNLDDSFRTIFVMRELDGRSIADVASALEVSQELVKVRHYRAKEKLRRTLSQTVRLEDADAFVFLGEDCRRLHAKVTLLIRTAAEKNRAGL